MTTDPLAQWRDRFACNSAVRVLMRDGKPVEEIKAARCSELQIIRPKVGCALTPAKQAQMRDAYSCGMTNSDVSRTAGVSWYSAKKYRKEWGFANALCGCGQRWDHKGRCEARG